MKKEKVHRIKRKINHFPRVFAVKHPDSPLIFFLFTLFFLIRVATSARTITPCDAGDFLSALVTAGNCHSPGYPLYLMTARVFIFLFPFGSIPFRASIYSALFASITCCLVYLIVFRITKSRFGGLVASISFSFSYTFWSQSIIPETYSLNAFFIALMILLALRWENLVTSGERKKADNTLFALAFVAGLALSNHMTSAFAVVAVAIFLLDIDIKAVLNLKNLTRILLFFILGLLPYIYIPAAAFRGPAYNFGDPSTPLRWFQHISMHYNRSGIFGYPLIFMPSRFLRFLKSFLTEFPYIWLLGWIGLLLSFRTKNRRHGAFLLLTFLFLTIPVMLYRQQEGILRAHFYYPAYMVFSIWIGVGAVILRDDLKDLLGKLTYSFQKFAAGTLSLFLITMSLFSIPTHYPKVNNSKYPHSKRMAESILKQTERNAIVIIDNDNVYFPAKYIQISRNLRPDVRLILPSAVNAPGFDGKDLLYRETPHDKKIKGSKLVRIVEKNFHDNPVYYTYQGFVDHTWSYEWNGYSLKVKPPGAPDPDSVSNDEAFKEYPLYGKNISSLDSDEREAISFPLIMLATYRVGRGEFDEAIQVYERITSFFLKDHYVFSLYACLTFSDVYEFYGLALNTLKRYREVIRRIPKAREFNPDFRSTQLAFAYRMLNMNHEALKELDDFIIFNPREAYAYRERGAIYFNRGYIMQASKDLSKAVELEPDDHQLRFFYALTLLELGKENSAYRELKKIIRKAPESEWAQKAIDILKVESQVEGR